MTNASTVLFFLAKSARLIMDFSVLLVWGSVVFADAKTHCQSAVFSSTFLQDGAIKTWHYYLWPPVVTAPTATTNGIISSIFKRNFGRLDRKIFLKARKQL